MPGARKSAVEQAGDWSFVVEADLVRIPAEDAASICQAAELNDDANALLKEDDAPRAYLARLLLNGFYDDGLTFLAYALPKREVIWWFCVAFRQHLGGSASELDERALQIAETWVYEPNQTLCQAAGEVAEESEYRTPAGLIAASVYWAGDSIAPPDCPKVPPREDLTHKGVASAISLGLIATQNAAVRDQLTRILLSTGIKIAQGATGKTALLDGISNASLSTKETS